jgi:chromate transporter
MPEPVENKQEPAEVPGLVDLFRAFAGISIMGFGGVLPWARRALVEQRSWLSAQEFAEVLALGQFVPGGNVINVAIVVGQRFRGPLGSLAAAGGLLAAPLLIVVLCGAVYLRFAADPRVHAMLEGVTAAAVGLMIATALKMAVSLASSRAVVPLVFAGLTFLIIGIAGVPLTWALPVLVPASVAFCWRAAR